MCDHIIFTENRKKLSCTRTRHWLSCMWKLEKRRLRRCSLVKVVLFSAAALAVAKVPFSSSDGQVYDSPLTVFAFHEYTIHYCQPQFHHQYTRSVPVFSRPSRSGENRMLAAVRVVGQHSSLSGNSVFRKLAIHPRVLSGGWWGGSVLAERIVFNNKR